MEVEVASFFGGGLSVLADNGRDIYPRQAINKSRRRSSIQRRAAPRPFRGRLHALEEIQARQFPLNTVPRQHADGVASLFFHTCFCPDAPWFEPARHGDSL
ncbi:MAG: hypothetical protein AABZ84_10765, partial [Pseudomonadota bacterium]